jgi:photosystem I subunit 8
LVKFLVKYLVQINNQLERIIMTDVTQMTGSYALSWLPWIFIPLITYILPFPVFALLFLWIEKEGTEKEV